MLCVMVQAPGLQAQEPEEENFWPGPFKCVTEPDSGFHRPGSNCMKCHEDFEFGGTIYKKEAPTAGAANVEVGIRHKNGFVSVCSGKNGNIYIKNPEEGSAPIDWPTARLRIRTADNVEKKKAQYIDTKPECNSCHRNMSKILTP
jgi:hypothetical protein